MPQPADATQSVILSVAKDPSIGDLAWRTLRRAFCPHPALTVVIGVVFTLLVGLVLPSLAGAQTVEDRVRRVGSQLGCPVCEGQTVADSNAGLAQDMRGVIRQRIEAGDSDQQILDLFVASYGDGILVDPPKRGFTLGLWVGPVVLLLLGGLVLAWLARGWVRRGTAEAAPTTVAVDAPVLDELNRFREGFGR